MSKVLSLKLRDDIFTDTEAIRKRENLPRNAYINKALEVFNKMQKRSRLKLRLHQESKAVAKESLSILAEFERIEEL